MTLPARRYTSEEIRSLYLDAVRRHEAALDRFLRMKRARPMYRARRRMRRYR